MEIAAYEFGGVQPYTYTRLVWRGGRRRQPFSLERICASGILLASICVSLDSAGRSNNSFRPILFFTWPEMSAASGANQKPETHPWNFYYWPNWTRIFACKIRLADRDRSQTNVPPLYPISYYFGSSHPWLRLGLGGKSVRLSVDVFARSLLPFRSSFAL